MRSLAQEVQYTEESVTLAFVDQGYTGPKPAQAAKQEGMQLHCVTGKKSSFYFCVVGVSRGVLAGSSTYDNWQGTMRDYHTLGRAALCRLQRPHATQCR